MPNKEVLSDREKRDLRDRVGFARNARDEAFIRRAEFNRLKSRFDTSKDVETQFKSVLAYVLIFPDKLLAGALPVRPSDPLRIGKISNAERDEIARSVMGASPSSRAEAIETACVRFDLSPTAVAALCCEGELLALPAATAAEVTEFLSAADGSYEKGRRYRKYAAAEKWKLSITAACLLEREDVVQALAARRASHHSVEEAIAAMGDTDALPAAHKQVARPVPAPVRHPVAPSPVPVPDPVPVPPAPKPAPKAAALPGAEYDYDNPEKNRWRKKLSEFIGAHTSPVQRRVFRVLCLPGVKCREFGAYRDLGFSPKNLYGAENGGSRELPEERREANRKAFLEEPAGAGTVRYAGELTGLLDGFREQFDVVSLDFHSCLTVPGKELLRKIPVSDTAIVAVNFMAKREGRDIQADLFGRMEILGAKRREVRSADGDEVVPDAVEPADLKQARRDAVLHLISRNLGLDSRELRRLRSVAVNPGELDPERAHAALFLAHAAAFRHLVPGVMSPFERVEAFAKEFYAAAKRCGMAGTRRALGQLERASDPRKFAENVLARFGQGSTPASLLSGCCITLGILSPHSPVPDPSGVAIARALLSDNPSDADFAWILREEAPAAAEKLREALGKPAAQCSDDEVARAFRATFGKSLDDVLAWDEHDVAAEVENAYSRHIYELVQFMVDAAVDSADQALLSSFAKTDFSRKETADLFYDALLCAVFQNPVVQCKEFYEYTNSSSSGYQTVLCVLNRTTIRGVRAKELTRFLSDSFRMRLGAMSVGRSASSCRLSRSESDGRGLPKSVIFARPDIPSAPAEIRFRDALMELKSLTDVIIGNKHLQPKRA